LPDCAQIVGGSRHQIAGAMFVKKRERLVDKVTIKLLSHIVLDIARHVDEYPALQKEKDTADQACSQHFTGGDGEFCPGNVSPILINRPANYEGNKESGGNAAEDANDTERQLKLVFAEIECKFL
jgi:hypothetical protein